MATQTFVQKIDADLRALVSTKKLQNWSNQDDHKDSEGVLHDEDTDKTIKVAVKAAGWVRGYIPVSDNYDDADDSVGDQRALDFGVARAIWAYSQLYSVSLGDSGFTLMADLRQEIMDYAETLRQEAANIVVVSPDNDNLNARFPHTEWTDDND